MPFLVIAQHFAIQRAPGWQRIGSSRTFCQNTDECSCCLMHALVTFVFVRFVGFGMELACVSIQKRHFMYTILYIVIFLLLTVLIVRVP